MRRAGISGERGRREKEREEGVGGVGDNTTFSFGFWLSLSRAKRQEKKVYGISISWVFFPAARTRGGGVLYPRLLLGAIRNRVVECALGTH